MKVSFKENSLLLLVGAMRAFLYDIENYEAPDVAEDSYAPAEPKLKRKRRTKAEMEAAASAEEALAAVDRPEDEPKTRTRRRRGKKADENPTTDVAPIAGRRSKRAKKSSAPTAKSPSDDELKDADLVKAASALAQATNPAVVTELLEEFGVGQVSELSGDTRREFLTSVNELIENGEN